MRSKLIIATVLITSVFAFTLFQVNSWKITDGYTVTFKSSRMNGSFRGLNADIFFDEHNLAASKISARISAKTIDTGIGLRNRHAQSETGLNAEKFPEISFLSTRIIKTGTSYEATGKLTLREVSKEIKMPFTFERTGTSAIFKGKFSISPKDYNITKFGTPDPIEIELMVPTKN